MVHVYSLSFIRSAESLGWPFAINLWSTFYGVCQQLYIFNFLKTALHIVNIISCKLWNFWLYNLRASWMGPNMKKPKLSKIFFSTSTHVVEKLNAWLWYPWSPLPKLGKIMALPWSGVQSLREGQKVGRGGDTDME